MTARPLIQSAWLLLAMAGSGLCWRSPVSAQPTTDAPPGPSAPADAAEPASEVPADANALTPPRALAIFPPSYPPDVEGPPPAGAVTLEIEIGSDGFVREALVREGVAPAFDEAVRAALSRSVFEPATRGDTPIPARILYRFDLASLTSPQAAEAAEPAEEAPTTGELDVEVLSARDDAVLSGVGVRLTTPDDPELAVDATTDEQGHARFSDLSPGAYEVLSRAEGYDDQLQTEQVVAGEATEVRYRMTTAVQGATYGAQARVEAPPREITRRTIERDQLTRVAGTRGDALRTIELLPGVARPPFGAGLVIIRGASPQDSSVLLDGTEVPLLYHFGGLTSFYNSRALERIDFYPGNFSARYGRKTGGIVDVEVRDPDPDGYHGVLDVNLPLDSSLLIEGPITDKSAFLVAGRRSYFGEVLTLLIPEGTFDAFAAPVYYDAQALVTYYPTPRDRVRFLGYISGDGAELLFSDAPPEDPTIRGVEFNLNFQRLQTEWRHRYSDDLTHDIRVSYGRNPTLFDLGPEYYFDLNVHQVTVRAEWRYQIHPKAAVIVGTDTVVGRFNIDYRGPPPQQDEGNPGGGGSVSTQPLLRLDNYNAPSAQPGFYIENDLRPFDDWQFILGLRVDYDQYIQESWFDPRFSALYQVTPGLKLKAAVGVYSQPPQVQQTVAAVGGNPNLQPTRSIHYGLGGDYEFNDAFSVGLEGFYKSLYDNVVAPPGGVGGANFVNDGTGRIYGMELSGRARGGERFFGFFSYTLMKSERNDRGEGYRPFDFDQRHILSVAGTYNFGNGWEVGGTYRVVTGNPITPVQPGAAASPINLDQLAYVAEFGATNSARAPTFHRLDLRVERKWTHDAWALAAYLDVQNVYNAKNPEGTTYNFDNTESGPLRGLPIIPIIGLRGEM